LTHEYGTVRFSRGLLKKVYPLCRDANWEITLTLIENGTTWELIQLEAGDQRERHFGIAVDLGSTSVAMKLVDLNAGKVLGEESSLNDQIQYGDDILSRIFYAKNKPEHLSAVQQATVSTFNALLKRLEIATGINAQESFIMVVSGNTTMIHFLLGIDPWPIFEYPFAPVFNHTGYLEAQELGINTGGYLYCMPSVANYLGGDTVSGLLVAGLHEKEELGLFIDIGTNGEMVLGNRHFLVAGAGAAGPALEGGISKNGMKATAGAVRKRRFQGIHPAAYATTTIPTRPATLNRHSQVRGDPSTTRPSETNRPIVPVRPNVEPALDPLRTNAGVA